MNLQYLDLPQGSQEWFDAKLGVISASNVHKLLAKKGTDTRSGYISELIAQIVTKESPELFGAALDWGKEQEGNARSIYSLETEQPVLEVGFIYGPDRRTGCSPDGIVLSKKKGLEIKCPFTSKVHIDFLLMDKIKLEYIYQVQFSMWITGYEFWDFCSYDPRAGVHMLKIWTVEKSPEIQERLSNEIPEFIKEMDAGLDKLGINFGEQWL